jgi:TRAP-type uncharacterized transport system substrate-binding protein
MTMIFLYLRWASVVVIVAVIGLIALVSYAVVRDTSPINSGRIVVAAGSAQYFDLAESYRRDLERYGVKYEVQQGTGGSATMKALLEAGPGINAGFIQGGLVGSLQGSRATVRPRGRYSAFWQLQSVGRLFYEPIWVFTRGDLPITSLRDLKGRKILVTREGGMQRIANQLLKANGIDRSNTTLIAESLPANAAPLLDGGADAAFLIEPADADLIQRLLRVENIRLMDFSAEAEAYANSFPHITTVVLRRGAVEFTPLIPTADITLLSTTAVLVVRKDVHPALISLLTQAVINNPKPGFDKQGNAVLFHRAGEFPSANDPEFSISGGTRAVYKTGQLPTLLRTLAALNAAMGVPFSFTAFISSYAVQMLLVLIPVLAVTLPIVRIGGTLYQKYTLRRLLRAYQELRALERMWESGRYANQETAYREELDRMAARLDRLRMPFHLSDHLLDLRERINFIREGMEAKSNVIKLAAE